MRNEAIWRPLGEDAYELRLPDGSFVAKVTRDGLERLVDEDNLPLSRANSQAFYEASMIDFILQRRDYHVPTEASEGPYLVDTRVLKEQTTRFEASTPTSLFDTSMTP